MSSNQIRDFISTTSRGTIYHDYFLNLDLDRVLSLSLNDENPNVDVILIKNIDFNLKSFESCENLEIVMEKYIKNYFQAQLNKLLNNL